MDAAASLPCNIKGDDVFENFEVTEIDGGLLMSLLEESQGDYHDEGGDDDDDERLRSVIRSLEAEINPNTMDGRDHLSVQQQLQPELGSQSSDAGRVDGQDCWISHDLDHNWMDVDINNWYMDPCGDEMDGIIEFGGELLRDYSNIYHGVPLEEHAFGSLWQETQTSVL